MAKQVIGLGNAANDGTGDKIRIAGDKINDNFTELYDAVELLQADLITAASLVRSKTNVACNGQAGQVIGFSSQFASVYAITIIDYEGIGITVTSSDEDGFTITSLSAGTFGYIALIEV
jgi:hypothetical protein